MKGGALPFALREVQRDFARPVLWVVLAGIGVILALAGAFGTGGVMRPLPLALYWMITVTGGYALGAFTSAVFRHAGQSWPRPVRLAVTGLVIGALATAIIMAMNIALFGQIYGSMAEVAGFAALVIAVASVITVLIDIAFAAIAPPAPETTPAPAGPAILDRIPFERRGRLLALSVEDHYVRIRTTKGEEMVLMRLGDAMRETAPTPGLQIHRSHWVATGAIASVRREGSAGILTLTDGHEVPVSRANLPKLRDAGFL
ncbi:MAG: LytTR family DNA-binding domain-containing protein [Shimia sp.]